LSPDGKRLAFAAANPREPDEISLYTANADGTGVKPLVAGAALPAWSPDGSRPLYSLTTVPPGIGVVNAHGPGPHQLSVRQLLAAAPFWSPDGKRIGFTGADRPEPKVADIFLANADGSDVERLTDRQKLYLGGAGAWSPDGKSLAVFAADLALRRGDIQVWDLDH